MESNKKPHLVRNNIEEFENTRQDISEIESNLVQDETQRYQSAIYQLQQIISLKEPFTEKVQKILAVVMEYMGSEVVSYGRIFEDTFKLLCVESRIDVDMTAGQEVSRDNGIWPPVIDDAKPLACTSVSKSKFKDTFFHQGMGFESYLGVPIFINNEAVGTLCNSSRQRRTEKFTESEIDFMQLIAKWIGTELERELATQKLIRNEQATRNLYKITSNYSLSFDEKVDQILELCANFLDVEVGIFGELTEDKYKLINVFNTSSSDLKSGQERAREGLYCDKTASLNKVVALHHVANTDFATLPGYHQLNFETYLAIPLEINNHIFGTACFFNPTPREDAFTEAEIEFIQLAAQWITSEKQRTTSEQALKISEERFSLAMQGASDGLWDWNIVTNDVYLSPRWKSMLGYEEHEVMNELDSFKGLLHPDDLERTFSHTYDFINGEVTNYHIEFRMQHKHGHYVHVLSRGFGVKNESGEMVRMVGTHTDISENTRLAQQLEYQASHDSLTSLVNRAEFEKRLQRLINEQSTGTISHALCYLDLDNFKVINDTCGHLAGDAMLKQLSELLLTSIRSRDTLARLGGDEFAILMEHCSIQQAQNVAEKILKIVQDFRFFWDENKFIVGVSIGLVPINDVSGNVNDILSAADSACYMAKDAGRNCMHIFSPEDDEMEKRKGEMQWVARINQAIEDDSFCLFYQEVMAANKNKTVNNKKRFEVLIRIKNHDNSYVKPGAFLPAAERYNLSVKIDRWVIQATLNWLSTDKTLLAEIESCAINISGHSLSNTAFLNFCLDKIKTSGVPAEKICFEITETAVIANLNSAIYFIDKLKEMGCRFALDDFGSGLSSFGYLKNLPVDYLKIDGTFVRDIITDEVDFEMVKVINRLGHIMGKQTIAEFVENDDIIEMLTDINVDYLQGFGITEPKPIEKYQLDNID